MRGWRPSSGYPLDICHRDDVVWSILWSSCGAPKRDFGRVDWKHGPWEPNPDQMGPRVALGAGHWA